MNTTNQVLDRIKSIHKLPSDYAIAKLLGIATSGMTRYRKKQSQFDDSIAYRAAKLADMEPLELVARLHKERAANDDDFEMWDTIEKRCELVNNLKKEEVAEAMKAAATGKLTKKQQAIFKAISEQCILCSIAKISEKSLFGGFNQNPH